MSYLGEFEQLILFSVLELGDDAYGVAIREMIEERTDKAVSSGAIYTALGRLNGRGFVSVRVDAPSDRRVGRPRKYYKIEPSGARALQATYSRVQAMAGGLIPKLTELAER
jgi:DNA-binding PadR family transcriptional regulator